MFSVEFGCVNCWPGVHASLRGQVGKASVSRGVGAPSAALEKKVHVQPGSSCQPFPPGTQHLQNAPLENQLPSVDH